MRLEARPSAKRAFLLSALRQALNQRFIRRRAVAPVDVGLRKPAVTDAGKAARQQLIVRHPGAGRDGAGIEKTCAADAANAAYWRQPPAEESCDLPQQRNLTLRHVPFFSCLKAAAKGWACKSSKF